MGFTEQWPGALSHYWFLATSEQMVFVLSLLILWIPRRLFVPIFVFCFVGAWLHRWIATTMGVAPMMVWYSPLSSMDSIAAGALIGLLYREKKETVTRLACRISVTLAAWVCLIGSMVIRLWGFDTAWIHSAETLEALFFGWLILRAAIGFTGFWGRALQFPSLVYTGVISYALYVFHPLLHTFVETTFKKIHFPSNPENIFLITTTFVLTFLAGILSWHLLEKPLISSKTKVPIDKK
jgi:peptidoglycan/LPS O-acetylase OafA/YrhL